MKNKVTSIKQQRMSNANQEAEGTLTAGFSERINLLIKHANIFPERGKSGLYTAFAVRYGLPRSTVTRFLKNDIVPKEEQLILFINDLKKHIPSARKQSNKSIAGWLSYGDEAFHSPISDPDNLMSKDAFSRFLFLYDIVSMTCTRLNISIDAVRTQDVADAFQSVLQVSKVTDISEIDEPLWHALETQLKLHLN